jgi:hypothetical protein
MRKPSKIGVCVILTVCSIIILNQMILMKSCSNYNKNELNILTHDFVKNNHSKLLQNQKNTYTSPFFSVHIMNWKTIDMKTLSEKQVTDYFLWTNQSSCRVIQYFGGIMVSSATGLVSMEGQKAVCLDYSVRPVGAMSGLPKRCLIYSFGINNEWSFDEAMELYGCEIFSFDPSMNVSHHNRTNYIHFYEIALHNMDKNDGWEMNTKVPTRTLSYIYDMLSPIHGGETVIDYLKIDIENAEWQVLPQILESGMMDKVRQLAVEVHVDFNKSSSLSHQQASILQSLENYGLIRFDSRPNINTLANASHGVENDSLFSGYEMAWYNSRILRNRGNINEMQ